MPDPIKFPPRPLAPGQVEVKLGAKRYVLNPDSEAERRMLGVCLCGKCAACKKRAADIDAFMVRINGEPFLVPEHAAEETTAEKSGLLAFPSAPEEPKP